MNRLVRSPRIAEMVQEQEARCQKRKKKKEKRKYSGTNANLIREIPIPSGPNPTSTKENQANGAATLMRKVNWLHHVHIMMKGPS